MNFLFGTLLFDYNLVVIPFPPTTQELLMEDGTDWISEDDIQLIVE